MIKIDIPANLVEEYFRKLGTDSGNRNSFLERIQNFEKYLSKKIAPQSLSADQKEFVEKISDAKFLKKIITGNPNELENIKNNELSRFNNLFKDESFSKATLEIFGYQKFRRSENAIWFAKSLNIKACLYCNSQYTLTTNRKALFDFDHFFSKDKYPYLSVSCYNLIPVCASCNRGKSNKDFSVQEYYHPYANNLDQTFRFSSNFRTTAEYLLNGNKNAENIVIDLKLKDEIIKGSKEEKIFENHKKNFHIEKIYQNHKDEVAELIVKSQIYNKTRKKELLDITFKNKKGEKENLFNEEELNQLIIGNYINEEDFLKRPLAKLTRDIAEELGLI